MKIVAGIVAMVLIAALDAVALLNGIDGVLFTTTIGLISGIGTAIIFGRPGKAQRISTTLAILVALACLVGCPGVSGGVHCYRDAEGKVHCQLEVSPPPK